MARRVFTTVLIFLLASACATGAIRVETGPFPETVDELADVSAARQRAEDEDKLLLVVLGANWCHDSKALIAAFDEPEMASLIEERYERVLINVGKFDRGFEVADLFGLPIYAHTPTLLIIEPETGVLINWDDHYIFRDAATLERGEIAAHLNAHSDEDSRLAEPQAGRDAIDAWATDTAKRIRGGYLKLAGYDEFSGDAFEADWRELRRIRYGFSADYPEALLRLEETGEVGELPEYAPMPWE